MSSEQGGAGRREVAWRVFAAEFDDATVEHSESDEERAPNYVITPTGARVNRLFVVGVLTEVEPVSDDVLRARIVDPTGAFVVYAGQYQPEAMAFLESATPPQFVAVTGKARTFQPEDSDQVFTSIRPESINRVDADTRDRWTVQTAEHTLQRVSTFADALELDEEQDVEQTLLERDVDSGLAAGIPLAMQHYGTTKAYLADVWSLALDAIRVVAGEIDADEVGPLTTAPDEAGDVDVDFDRSVAETAEVDVEPDVSPDVAEPETEAEAESAAEEPADAEAVEDAEVAKAESTPAEVEDAEDAAEVQPTDEDADPEVPQEQETVTDEEFEPEPDDEEELGTGEAADEMYEMDDEERQEVEEEYGTEFTTGAEVGSPGEADIETPTPDEDEADLQETSESLEEAPEQTETDDESDRDEEFVEDEAADQTEEATTDETTREDVDDAAEEAAQETPADLEDTVMDTMRELDEGDGVGREELMAAVVHDYDVTPAEVEDALQEALMSGQCYESGDDTFKPI